MAVSQLGHELIRQDPLHSVNRIKCLEVLEIIWGWGGGVWGHVWGTSNVTM